MEAIWIGAAFSLGLIGRQFGLPPLAGYLLAGFVLHAFNFESGPILDVVAHYGVLLLLFSVGLKLDLRGLLRQSILGTAIIHLAFTGILLGLALLVSTSLDWRGALFLAVTLGFSSTVLAAKVLEDRREVRAFHGRIAIGILIIQDFVAVGLLSFTVGHTPDPYALLLLGLPFIRPLLHKLLEISGHDELLVVLGLLLALAGGAVFEQVGLSSELGALVLGGLLSGHNKAVELFKSLWGLKEAFLVGFFLQISLTGWPDTTGLLYIVLLMLILPLKSLLFFFLLLAFKLRSRSAFLVSLGLSSYSEFALICVPVGIAAGWITTDWAVILALAITLSFMVTAPINRLAHRAYARLEPNLLPLETTERHPDEQPLLLGRSHILVLGMGRSGTAAYDFLKGHGMRVAGLDSDPTKVARHRKAGRRVLFADAEDPGLWQNLQLDEVKSVLITMPDAQSTSLSAKELRAHGFKGMIGATTRHHDEDRSLLDAGVDRIFLTYEESGVGLAEHIVEAMDKSDQDRIEKIVELDAPVARVWRAITDHEEFGDWFRVRLDGPFKVGETTTGSITYPGHEGVKWESVTERMEHERLFAFSWPPGAIDPDTTYNDDAKVMVEFHLQPRNNGTRLTIIESGFLQFPDSKRLDVLRSNREGWDIQAGHIAEYVAG